MRGYVIFEHDEDVHIVDRSQICRVERLSDGINVWLTATAHLLRIPLRSGDQAAIRQAFCDITGPDAVWVDAGDTDDEENKRPCTIRWRWNDTKEEWERSVEPMPRYAP